MGEKPEMFKSRRIDCIHYARTWKSFEFGKYCDKHEEQVLMLMVDNGLSTLQYQRILDHAENLNCKFYPSHHKVKEAKQLCCPHSISMTNISRNNFVDTLLTSLFHVFVTEKLRLSTNTAFEVMKWGCDGSKQTRSSFLRKLSVTKAFSAFV
ncbi:hypothetical protein AVEN_52755-1 [Araneus ventricosus]|uniref:Uncharacterized protein n=1 Tax=Araneus ventricosus TaxID=182803 RepID=A0A4Y2CW57_ARAVE|nr:hypothetical protein AVEN_52755-1 [Araneus ventricosus]